MKWAKSNQVTAKPATTSQTAAPVTTSSQNDGQTSAKPSTDSQTRKAIRKVVGVSCTPAELEQILAGAQIAGLKPGPFLLACALKSNAELLRGRDLFLEKKLRDIITPLLQAKAKT